jgi:CubicO group peptidase (beta-lactamase class C family)
MQDHGTTWTRALGLALVALLLLGGRGPAAPAAFGAELVNASGRWSFGSAAEFLRADAADRLGERVRDLLVAGVERGDFASAVGLVAVRGETVVHEAVGSAVAFRTPDEPLDRPIPARPDTIYDIASITKLFTATAALQLVEQGKLDLDVPIATYLPGLAKTFAGGATTRQLLTHTAGFPPGFGSELRRAGNDPIRALALVEGRAPHGAKRVYSDIGLIALGEVVAAVSGERLDAYVARHIAEPLRLTETRYRRR